MSSANGYDITNEEQLRIINERLDAMGADASELMSDWQDWRKGVDRRLGEHTDLIAERLTHPLMDAETVLAIRDGQKEMARHLTQQDTSLSALAAKINSRFDPLERIAMNLDRVVKMLRWTAIAFGGGALYEVGRILAERWLK